MECPDSIEELEELEKFLPLCKMTLYKQAQARHQKDPDKSERQVTREIAVELDRSPGTIRTAVRRAKMESVTPPAKPKPKSKPNIVTFAMDILVMIISQLERIAIDDPLREEAFDEVIEWIHKNRKER